MKALAEPLAILFRAWLETDTEPTSETEKAYEKFLPEEAEANWESHELLVNAIVSEQEKAFRAGFDVARCLLLHDD